MTYALSVSQGEVLLGTHSQDLRHHPRIGMTHPTDTLAAPLSTKGEMLQEEAGLHHSVTFGKGQPQAQA